MKERNEYDDLEFFQQYQQMTRSREGLSGAGEWHQMKSMFPPVMGKDVLDLGCGYGWHCRFAEEAGARKILGIDSSRRMLEEAARRNKGERITYSLCGICDYEYPEQSWDLVVSNLALHYIEELADIFSRIYTALRPGGVFLFNIEHPVFTAGVDQEWIRSQEGEALYWPVDRYFYPGPRDTSFLGCRIKKQHHTLEQILMGLLDSGFILKEIREARPSEEMLTIPGMKDELRRPMMLLVRAERPGLV